MAGRKGSRGKQLKLQKQRAYDNGAGRMKAKRAKKTNLMYEQRASLFFKLPPELRNRIYSLVLGGRVIHVFRNNTQHREEHMKPREGWICDEPAVHQPLLDLVGAAHLGKKFERSDRYSNGFFCRTQDNLHFSSLGSMSTVPCEENNKLPVQVLRVCRRIHREANLVLFAENHFVFDSDIEELWDLEFFDTSFGVQQRRVIASAEFLDIYSQWLHRLSTLFPGLQRVFIDIYGDGEIPFLVSLDPSAGECRRFEERLKKWCELLLNMKLTGAAVSLLYCLLLPTLLQIKYENSLEDAMVAGNKVSGENES